MAVQRFVFLERQYSHCRHSGTYSGMTWSPARTVVTPGPTSATTAPPSWPRMAGERPSGSAPDRVKASVWQTPVALISRRTSPAFGPSRSTVSMVSGAPARCATAALTFIVGRAPLRRRTIDNSGLLTHRHHVAHAAAGQRAQDRKTFQLPAMLRAQLAKRRWKRAMTRDPAGRR